jgi:lysozyme
MIDCVVDLSHFQRPSDFGAAKGAGLLGTILKATQGSGHVDPSFVAHRSAARSAGLLTGSYHFGTGDADGDVQAAHFLAQCEPGDLLCLDYEPNPSGPSMTPEQASAFIVAVVSTTGNTPVLYGGSSLKALGSNVPEAMTDCPLWLAQYGPTAVLPHGWASWSLWQYSDGSINAPPSTWPGIGVCDRDRFNGAPDDLAAFWLKHAMTAERPE